MQGSTTYTIHACVCFCICGKTKQSLKYNMNNILYFYFVAYYFTLSLVASNKTMRDGSISFLLLNSFKRFEFPRLYV